MTKIYALSIFCLLSATALGDDSNRPNIIFIFADDQRADTIAAHGNPDIRTPNLDQLAAEGMSFRRNYCAGSSHGAVCLASRAMLVTGRHWMMHFQSFLSRNLCEMPNGEAACRTEAVWRSLLVLSADEAEAVGCGFRLAKPVYQRRAFS